MTEEERRKLRGIKTFRQLIEFLRDELDWPIEHGDDEDELTFDWSDDLGLKDEERVAIKQIKQLRPLETGQPWGIFFVEFEKKSLPIVILRRVLNALVLKKRASANRAQQAAWKQRDLLFISAYGQDLDRQLTFAHFSEPSSELDPGKATLRVLGWDDDDTSLKLDYVADMLKAKLTWPKDTTDLKGWRQRWSEAFELRHREVINTAADLALRLADLAKRIRNRMLLVLPRESESGELRKLLKGFQAALIHDLDEAQFADMYAQTITYGLFSAAVSRTVPGAGTAVHQGNVIDMVPVTNPFLREMLASFLKAGGRRGKLDFDELGIQEVVDLLNDPRTHMDAVLRDFGNRTRGEDPVIHFYEEFLKAYDKKLKVRRGVFYTPQPVVAYIVRGVHELLQTEFGLVDGLADITTWGEMLKKHPGLKLPSLTDEPGEMRSISPDEPFVQILDPATGTATFLVEVIDVIYRTLAARWRQLRLTDAQQRAAWNEYVPNHLLPRLHAYELMMAPYAIAHMKIGLKLAETGYGFGTNERARIYLTNALEPWVKQLPLIGFDALAHEAAAVNEIKRRKCFTVVIGNPPYSDASQNMGEWTAPLIEPFRFFQKTRIKERGAIRFEHCINNDYVKFWGLALALMDRTPLMVAELITSNTFLGGKSFRGVRDAMLDRASRIDVLDLHGEGWAGELAKQGVKDENVFAITTGVAITSLAKLTSNRGNASVLHREMTGTYLDKVLQLTTPTRQIAATQVVLDSRHYFPFTSQIDAGNDEYWMSPQLDTLFSVSVDGIKTSRDGLVIANSPEACKQKILKFAECESGLRDIEQEFCISAKNFDIRSAQRHLKEHFDEKLIMPILYRPFDIRCIYYDKELILSHRMNVMPSMFHKQAWSLVFASRLSSKGFDHVIACAGLCANKCASHDINSRMFPVVGLFKALTGEQVLMSNLSDELLSAMPKGRANSGIGRASEIGEYIYAVVNAPSYRSRYHESISQDFPRVPLTTSSDLFTRLSDRGKALVKLHTMSERPPHDAFLFSGPNRDLLTRPRWSECTMLIGNSSKIAEVERDIWEFRSCGYNVCTSWFSAGSKAKIQREGETLTKEYVLELRTMLWSIRETIRIRGEIDEIIDGSGGWPIA